MKRLLTISLFSFVFIYAQDSNTTSWFNKDDIAKGKELFAKNCAVCHGKEAVGPKGDWHERLANGKMKPPPLNGTAHTWHNKPELLLKIIANGGNSYGDAYKGWMPEFKDTLTSQQRLRILKYIHSLWPKNIQEDYDKFFKIK